MSNRTENITPDKLVLLIVSEAGKPLRGKTLLQKRAYFLSKMLGLDLAYRPHYYGPYSPEVEEGLARSKSLGFIEERTLGFGMSDQIGFEVRRYDYELTDDGKEIMSNLKKRFPDQYEKVSKCLKSLVKAGDSGDHVMLSIAAKAFHILQDEEAPMTSDDIRKAASKIGWQIDPQSLDRSVSFLEKLELIKTTKN